jgi:hypothetical protein
MEIKSNRQFPSDYYNTGITMRLHNYVQMHYSTVIPDSSNAYVHMWIDNMTVMFSYDILNKHAHLLV